MSISKESPITEVVPKAVLGSVLGIQVVQVPNQQVLPVQSCDCSDGGCIGDSIV